MPFITVTQTGDFSKTLNFLQKNTKGVDQTILDHYGREGVKLLKANTPVDSGRTRDGWYYVTKKEPGRSYLEFCNSNVQNGVPIAIIIQYGHATKNGAWIQGVEYINKSIQPVFNKITNDIWKGVTG